MNRKIIVFIVVCVIAVSVGLFLLKGTLRVGNIEVCKLEVEAQSDRILLPVSLGKLTDLPKTALFYDKNDNIIGNGNISDFSVIKDSFFIKRGNLHIEFYFNPKIMNKTNIYEVKTIELSTNNKIYSFSVNDFEISKAQSIKRSKSDYLDVSIVNLHLEDNVNRLGLKLSIPEGKNDSVKVNNLGMLTDKVNEELQFPLVIKKDEPRIFTLTIPLSDKKFTLIKAMIHTENDIISSSYVSKPLSFFSGYKSN